MIYVYFLELAFVFWIDVIAIAYFTLVQVNIVYCFFNCFVYFSNNIIRFCIMPYFVQFFFLLGYITYFLSSLVMLIFLFSTFSLFVLFFHLWLILLFLSLLLSLFSKRKAVHVYVFFIIIVIRDLKKNIWQRKKKRDCKCFLLNLSKSVPKWSNWN